MRITRNDFDSNIFGKSIGKCKVDSEDPQVSDATAKRILEDGGWDMLSIESSAKQTHLSGFFVGELVKLRGSASDMQSRLSEVQSRHNVENLGAGDWEEVQRLQEFASPTRFSSDSKLASERVIEHKLKMLKVYQRAEPELCLKVQVGSMLRGFQVCARQNDTLLLYEILIDPILGGPFCAVDLIRAAIRRAEGRSPDCKNVCTKIYSNNNRSMAFFKKIGMRAMASKNFYHIWR